MMLLLCYLNINLFGSRMLVIIAVTSCPNLRLDTHTLINKQADEHIRREEKSHSKNKNFGVHCHAVLIRKKVLLLHHRQVPNGQLLE